MATTKRPCKKLDLDVMTNREVVSELSRMYGNLLDRISAFADVLGADHQRIEELVESEHGTDFDSVYDEAVGLISRIEEAGTAFQWGNGSLRSSDGDRWNWGLMTMKRKLKERAIAGLPS